MSAGAHMQRQIAIVAVMEAAPASAKKQLAAAFDGRASPREAIKAQCLVCMDFDREAIRNCTGWKCPLWKYRPMFGENNRGAE